MSASRTASSPRAASTSKPVEVCDRARPLGADAEVVAVALVGVAEDLGRDREVEGDDLVEREHGDPVHGRAYLAGSLRYRAVLPLADRRASRNTIRS